MKKLIVSDTHRKDESLHKIIAETESLDMLIHLGDSEGSEDKIAGWIPAGCEGSGNREVPGFADSWSLLQCISWG